MRLQYSVNLDRSLHNVGRVLRPVVILLGILLVILGLAIIYLDRPIEPGGQSVIDVSYHCPKHGHLVILEVPTIKVHADNSGGFSGEFLAGFASRGSRVDCRFHLMLPQGSSYQRDPTQRNVNGDVAVGMAPPYSSDPKKQRAGYIDYTFTSPEQSVWPDGLGRQTFGLVISTGLNGTSLPTVTPPGDSARSLELQASCPDKHDQVANTYPSSSSLLSADTAVWPVESTVNGSAFTAICENSDKRFWVDNTTDAIVLGLGLLLSVMVERRQREEPRPLQHTSGTNADKSPHIDGEGAD